MISSDALFKPFHLKGLALPNRVVMAPMTRGKSPHQIPTDDVAAYYRARAEGGVGLILTEGTSPQDLSASNNDRIPAFFGEESLQGWTKVLAAVKSVGGHIMPQIWHHGVRRAPNSGPYPDAPTLSPSGLDVTGDDLGAPMTATQIDAVIGGFVTSAVAAQRLGFDGIELHGAHGYLIDEFLWDRTNRREDAFGGSVEKRTRFATDIVKAVRAATGPAFPILFRFSQWKIANYAVRLAETPAELAAYLGPLADAGVDVFHASTRRFWLPEYPEADARLNLAGWAKKITGLPAITVGSVTLGNEFAAGSPIRSETDDSHTDTLISMLERGDFDLVAVGRALIANPDWAHKMRSGEFSTLKAYEPAMLQTLS